MKKLRCRTAWHKEPLLRHGDVFVSCDGLAHVVKYDFTSQSICGEVWWHRNAKAPSCLECVVKMWELPP